MEHSCLNKSRDALLDKVQVYKLFQFYLKKAISELPADQVPMSDFIENYMGTQYKINFQRVFLCAQSPIELIFLNSFLLNCLCNRVLVVVDELYNEDFIEGTKTTRELYCLYNIKYKMYHSLPVSEKPATYVHFIEKNFQKTRREAIEEAGKALLLFDTGRLYNFHITLQPWFHNFIGKKSVRADAVLWMPGNEHFQVVLECDGYKFHSNKEQFTQDRVRDRVFRSKGFDVRRYSGTEIYRNHFEVANDLFEFICCKGNDIDMARFEWECYVQKKISDFEWGG